MLQGKLECCNGRSRLTLWTARKFPQSFLLAIWIFDRVFAPSRSRSRFVKNEMKINKQPEGRCEKVQSSIMWSYRPGQLTFFVARANGNKRKQSQNLL